MAHQEACQLYIEQQIKEGLEEGKTPYSIGKDLSAWVEKLFETNIPVNTLIRRAERAREIVTTNVVTPITPGNLSTIPEKQTNQQVKERQQEPGPGRAPKYHQPRVAWSDAMQMADLAIDHLGRIFPEDPLRRAGYQKVLDWIEAHP